MSLANAAGTAKTLEAAVAVLRTTAPAVVLGSFTLAERTGNDGTVDYFGPSFSLNVRGIPSPPPSEWTGIVRETARQARALGRRVVVSVAAFEPSDYAPLIRMGLDAGADEVEANFDCPNMQEGGRFAPIISYRPHLIRQALDGSSRLDGLNGRVWAKVSPIFDDALFAEVADVLRWSGCAGVVATNTLPQCTALDDAGNPVLSFGTGVGGMAGPALKPIALAQAARWVREGLRVIGVGGIASGKDLRDYLAVGVELCQANTVLQVEGAGAIDRILAEAT